MKYISSSFEEINIDEKLCLTIGNFDGIHKGHREIIKNLLHESKISESKSAILYFVFTHLFSNDPANLFDKLS